VQTAVLDELPLAPRGATRALLEQLLGRLIPALARWTHGRLPRHARRRCDSWDLVQDAWSGALQHLDSLDLTDAARVHAYLQQAIRNRIRDEIRRSRIGEVGWVDGISPVDRGPSPLDDTLESDERRRFRLALLALPDPEQLLVVGRVELHLEYDDLARATGRVSAEAARRAVGRAMMRLGRELAKVEARERAAEASGRRIPAAGAGSG
jgi:RNA polymerase sigma-70 factor (ECF subfamily)